VIEPPPSTPPTNLISKDETEKKTEKIEIFNGKNLDGWKIINNNANWQVWQKNLYGRLPSSDKNASSIYFTKKQFKNFYLSFQYKLISGMFYVCYYISNDNPSEKYSFIYLNNYDKTDGYATFSAKVVDDVSIVSAPQGKDGDAVLNPATKEGYIGFLITPGTEIYLKDIVVEEITQTAEELVGTIAVPLINGQDIKNWKKSGAKGEWKIVNGTIYGENNISKKEQNTIDLSTLSVLYFDDNNFKPEWTNYTVSFEFNIAEEGFIVFGKFPTEGSASGTQITKKLFEIGKWYQAQVIVTPSNITTKFSDENIGEVNENIDSDLKGYFGFGLLPGQKVYLRNIKLQFIK
ncbi:MAG: family 16 glycoside hydrolase, partial [Planctomycetota bacterium]